MKRFLKKMTVAAIVPTATLLSAEGIFVFDGESQNPHLNPEWICFEQPDLKLFKPGMLKAIPEKIGSVKPQKVKFTNDKYQFKRVKCRLEDHALFFNEFELKEDTSLNLGFGADWFMKVWLDGQVLVNTLKTGNSSPEITIKSHFARVNVSKGRHLLVAEVHSGNGSFTFAAGELRGELTDAPKLFADLAKTDWRRNQDAERKKLLTVIEDNVLMTVSSTAFNKFNGSPKAKAEPHYDTCPIFSFYDKALDKLVQEIPQTKVPEGNVVLWHLYNMGCVVKTHNHCFGIDLHHRRGHLLAPYLDFILTTHNHSDHRNDTLLKELSKAGKKIYSSFYPASGYTRDPQTVQIDDITIRMGKSDHNAKLPGFITPYLIQIGTGKNSCVIYHTGDSCNLEQLNPDLHVNIWIPHPRVGLDVPKGAEKFKPDWIFFSHFLEMGHCKPCPYRPITYSEVFAKDVPACEKLGVRCTMPYWGEKIVWTPADKKVSEPKGRVCFTFDDARYKEWIQVLPLFRKYHAHATFFFNRAITPEAVSAMKQLLAEGHSIGLHTVDHRDAVPAFASQGAAEYIRTQIQPQLDACKSAGLNIRYFAYPNNNRSKETDQVLSASCGFQRFRAGVPRHSTSGLTIAQDRKGYLTEEQVRSTKVLGGFGIGAYYKSTQPELDEALEEAAKTKTLLVFFSHGISANPGMVDVNVAMLEACLKKAHELGLDMVSFDELP